MPMTQLETTLVSLARESLSLARAAASPAFDGEYEAGLMREGALTALLMLGHMADSGLGDEAKAALLAIEVEHAAWHRESAGDAQATLQNQASTIQCRELN